MRREQAAHIDEVLRAARGGPSGRDASIQQSWRRCLDEHRLDPAHLREPRILTETRLREHRDAMEEFTHTARFGVETLYRQVAGLGYVLLLTDARGVTVDFIGDPTFDSHLMRAGLYLGADWNESHAGTCAVGACIATREALIVHQTDHFDATHIPLTCTAAPVFDPSGELAGALDLSALRSPEPKESQFLTLQIVKGVANTIEIANLMNRFRREWILRLAPSPEFVDVEARYVIAVDGSGLILGFNHFAGELMRSEAGADGRPLVGRRLRDLFDFTVDDLPRLSHASPASQRLVRLARSGAPLFAHALAPPSRAPRSSANAAPAPTPLPAPLQALFCDDPAMRRAAERAARLVNTQMSLLICGETGSGKEQLAKAVHASSARATKPFVAVNCAALPESLIEGELFGYEPGAFTGAAARGRKGLVLESDGGTLFLDEIGDMPLTLQTRLLRVLAEREITPLGRSKPVPVDCRVIAATHRDLIAEVRAGRFREDLYFRISGAVLTLPPLRERTDRIWLIERLIAERVQGPALTISEAAMAFLLAYPWPGNVRELVNALDFACALASESTITTADLPDSLTTWPSDLPPGCAAEPSTGGASCAGSLIEALTRQRWNVSAVARDLGVDRTTVHRRMRRFGITASRQGDLAGDPKRPDGNCVAGRRR